VDFSLWDLFDSFRLHEAACLIAGVHPLSKRVPDREELPPEAIPIYVKLGSAYVLNWVAHNRDLPEDPKHPIESMLKASQLDGSGIPTLPEIEPLKRLTGEFVSRQELHRWIAAMGINSAYSFAQVAQPDTVAGKKWTPKKLDELKAYRDTHTMQETSYKFGISEQRIRQLLPSKKAKAQPYAGLIHRAK
jgi:hypothetical protein